MALGMFEQRPVVAPRGRVNDNGSFAFVPSPWFFRVPSSSLASRPPRTVKRLAWWFVQTIILVGVAVGVWYTINGARHDLAQTQIELERNLDELRVERDALSEADDRRSTLDRRIRRLERSRLTWSNVRPGYLVGCGVAYFFAMCPAWLFYHAVVRRMGQTPTHWESFRAFIVSQLGKYVPGKALVVILRAGLIRSDRCAALPATMAVFAETLLGMAVGATMGSLVLAWKAREVPWLFPVSIGMAILCVVPTLPPLFRLITTFLLARKFGDELPRYLRGMDWSFFGLGWLVLPWCWIFNGLSLWCAIQALPSVPTATFWMLFPLVVGVAALSVVAGFITLLPGGLVIRELIITTLLGPVIGPPLALGAAIAQRLTWLVVELSVSGLVMVIHPWIARQTVPLDTVFPEATWDDTLDEVTHALKDGPNSSAATVDVVDPPDSPTRSDLSVGDAVVLGQGPTDPPRTDRTSM